MILNTLDHLGKFDSKRDEGYFVRYSMSSKVFRVFNKRTKKVEENLHVDFLENKPIEKGAGPNWLFDIDTLTNSMNYVPVVVAGTSSTNISGTKDVASQDVKKDVSSLRYIALPNWFHEAHMETRNSDTPDGCNADDPESNGISNPTATSKVPSAEQVEPAVSLTVETKIPTIAFCDYHNMVAILEKTEYNTDFHQIVDFLEASHIRIETTNQETKILATVDGKPRTISESYLRRHLKLNDEEGISSLPDAELFENLSLMGYNILPNQRVKAQQTQLSPIPHPHDRNTIHHNMIPHLHHIQLHILNKFPKLPLILSPIGGIIKIGEKLGADTSTELGSNDIEEMVNVLSSIEAANILTSGVAAASVSPADGVSAAGVPTVSGSFSTVSAIFTTTSVVTPYTRRPRGITIGGEKLELISELVKYQDHHTKILKYQAQQSKPLSKKEQRELYMSVLRSHAGWKTKHFRGMTLEQLEAKFIPVWKQTSKSVSEDVSEEELKEMMQLVPLEEVYVEALHVKHPIIDWEIHSEGKREYWKIIRLGGHTAVYQFFIDMLKQFDKEDLHRL
uniref:Ribonuclease H-like domain-containing protein n=1 Tax=Tanacetum cinerariifolium TaxID=118510 RepID=A0A6L2MY37_TANCI|nr:ribonuclease H-like domain-containing protein [Tanacetum cinerariifolium]